MAIIIHTTPRKKRGPISEPNWTQPYKDEGKMWLPSSAQAYQLKRGWQLWIGAGWSRITFVDTESERPVIHCANAIGYAVDYLDSVKYRREWWESVR